MTTPFIILAIVIILAAFLAVRFNRLVALRNHFKNAFAQIDVQLKRRHDLIPNLVETAKGYLKHERETLEAVVAARNTAVSATSAAAADPTNGKNLLALGGAESALTGALGKLFALAEAYPDLKANQTMAALMEELTTTENKVSFARQGYNDSVMAYNTAREQLPDAIFASTLGFGPAQLFVITNEKEREVQKVAF